MKQKTEINLFGNRKFWGKHVWIVKGKVFAAKTTQEADKIYNDIRKRFPEEIPTYTYVPKTPYLIV